MGGGPVHGPSASNFHLMAKRAKRQRRGRQVPSKVSLMGSIRPTVFESNVMRVFNVTALGTTVSTFTYVQLLPDIKVGAGFDRVVKLQSVAAKFLPLNSSNTAAAMATATPAASVALTWADPTVSGTPDVMLTPFRGLSTTNSVTLVGAPPTTGTGWVFSDNSTPCVAVRLAVPIFTTSFSVVLSLDCKFLMTRDQDNNIV